MSSSISFDDQYESALLAYMEAEANSNGGDTNTGDSLYRCPFLSCRHNILSGRKLSRRGLRMHLQRLHPNQSFPMGPPVASITLTEPSAFQELGPTPYSRRRRISHHPHSPPSTAVGLQARSSAWLPRSNAAEANPDYNSSASDSSIEGTNEHPQEPEKQLEHGSDNMDRHSSLNPSSSVASNECDPFHGVNEDNGSEEDINIGLGCLPSSPEGSLASTELLGEVDSLVAAPGVVDGLPQDGIQNSRDSCPFHDQFEYTDSFCKGTELPPYAGCENKGHLLSPSDKAAILLLDLCEKIGGPLYSYDKIREWLDAALKCGFNPKDQALPSHETISSNLKNWLQFPEPEGQHIPIESSPDAPSHEKTTYVIRLSLRHQACQILTNPDLMTKNRLLLNPKAPWEAYIPNDKIFEIQDGWLYQETARRVHEDTRFPRNTVVAGLKVYIDKTHTESRGRFNLEPVVAVFVFFDWKTQQLSTAQIVLGYITDLELRSKASKGTIPSSQKGMNCRNYHRQLKYILEELVYWQERGGMSCAMCIDGVVHQVNLYMFVLIMAGDAKSHDNICGRFASHALGVNRAFWNCDCLSKDAGDPKVKCQFHYQWDVQEICDTALALGNAVYTDADIAEARETLQSMSQYALSNAFRDVHFGYMYDTDSPHFNRDIGEDQDPHPGIFLSCFMDTTHSVEIGLIKSIIGSFIGLLTEKGKKHLDYLAIDIFRSYQQSSLADPALRFPKTNFSKGISNLTLLTAKEWVGLAFVLAIILETERGHKLLGDHLEGKAQVRNQARISASRKRPHTQLDAEEESKADDECSLLNVLEQEEFADDAANERNRKAAAQDKEKDNSDADPDNAWDELLDGATILEKYSRVINAILVYHGWLHKRDGYWSTTDPTKRDASEHVARESIRSLMKLICDECPRIKKDGQIDGNGWDIPKMHGQLHIPVQISAGGSPINTDTFAGEHNHIPLAKNVARTAQKKHTVFVKQCGSRYTSRLRINIALQRYRLVPPITQSPPSPTDVETSGIYASQSQPWHMGMQSSKFYIRLLDRTDTGIPQTTEGLVVRTFWVNDLRLAGAVNMHHWVEEFILSYYSHRGRGMELYCATEFGQRLPGGMKKVVAAPHYRGEKRWYDWVLLNLRNRDTGNDVELLAQLILLFYEGNDRQSPKILVRLCRGRLPSDANEKDSVLVRHWRKAFVDQGRRPKLAVFPMQAIVKRVAVFEDDPTFAEGHHADSEQQGSDQALEVIDPATWGDFFTTAGTDNE